MLGRCVVFNTGLACIAEACTRRWLFALTQQGLAPTFIYSYAMELSSNDVFCCYFWIDRLDSWFMCRCFKQRDFRCFLLVLARFNPHCSIGVCFCPSGLNTCSACCVIRCAAGLGRQPPLIFCSGYFRIKLCLHKGTHASCSKSVFARVGLPPRLSRCVRLDFVQALLPLWMNWIQSDQLLHGLVCRLVLLWPVVALWRLSVEHAAL